MSTLPLPPPTQLHRIVERLRKGLGAMLSLAGIDRLKPKIGDDKQAGSDEKRATEKPGEKQAESEPKPADTLE